MYTHIYACAIRDTRTLFSETQNNVYFCHEVGVFLSFINQTIGNREPRASLRAIQGVQIIPPTVHTPNTSTYTHKHTH